MRSGPRLAEPKLNLSPLGPDIGEMVGCFCGAHVLLFRDGHKEEWLDGRRGEPHRCPAPWKPDDEYAAARAAEPITRGEYETGLERVGSLLEKVLSELQRLNARRAPVPTAGALPGGPAAPVPQGNLLELE